ncbi:MAG: hypothetical protein KUG82_19435 [Pseudomonadales bacterium]|nr:hypothetical protein [Pseudomonadales bacterium]
MFKLNCGQIVFFLTCFLLTSCKLTQNDSASGGTGTSSGANTATFVDGPVSGLSFFTTTSSGVTDDNGEFGYSEGVLVNFHIGSISLGSSEGKSIVSSFDLESGADSATHPGIINRLRFLQTLDSDSDLSNGISLSQAIRSAGEGVTIDFDQPISNFANDTGVLNFIAANTSSAGLVGITEASEHFASVIATHSLEPLALSQRNYKIITLLDPRDEIPFNVSGLDFSPLDALTYNSTSSITVLDSFGFSHDFALFFVKEPLNTDDPDTEGLPNTWSVYVLTSEGVNVGGSDTSSPTLARLMLRFDSFGLISGTSNYVISNWTPTYAIGDSSAALGPDPSNAVVNDPPSSSNFSLDFSVLQFGEIEVEIEQEAPTDTGTEEDAGEGTEEDAGEE